MPVYQCTKEDIKALQAISIQTFKETFGHDNESSYMDAYIKDNLNVAKLTKELENTFTFFYFLKIDETIAGYLKVNINDAQTEDLGKDTLEIERIYLKRTYQNKGLGKVLYDKAIRLAKQHNKHKVWLGVWEKNHQALKFYQKLNFERVGEHSFFLGPDEQTDYIMMKTI